MTIAFEKAQGGAWYRVVTNHRDLGYLDSTVRHGWHFIPKDTGSLPAEVMWEICRKMEQLNNAEPKGK